MQEVAVKDLVLNWAWHKAWAWKGRKSLKMVAGYLKKLGKKKKQEACQASWETEEQGWS